MAKKDRYFFDHDYTARNDDKILELRSKYGVEGYGLFWMIIETMCENENGGVKASLIGGLSLGYGVANGLLIELIGFCIKIELFFENEGYIYSKRVIEHKNFRNSFKKFGEKGAEKRWKTDTPPIAGVVAPLSPPYSPPNAKEKRVEESKEEESKINTAVSPVAPVSKKKRVSKKREDAEPYWGELIKVYFNFCFEKFNEKPSFTGSDPSDMHRIIESLKKRASEKSVEWTEETAKLRWREFLGRAFQDEWLSQNWLLPHLNRQKDKIFLNLISSKNGTHKQQIATIGKTFQPD
jgi:hypothetical protein